MAESTLSLTYAGLQAEVGFDLGYGRDPAAWTARYAPRLDVVAAAIKIGLRQFLFPPPLPGQPVAHEWSFSKPTTTLVTQAPYSTGTLTLTNGSTTVTLASGTWPSWAANGTISAPATGFPPLEVATRSSDSVVLLANAFQGTTASSLTYTLGQWTYDLPDAFGHFVGPLIYEDRSGYAPVTVTDEYSIRQYRQAYGTTSGTPQHVAMRPSDTVPGSTGQRFVAVFDRAFDAQYALSYRYLILPDALTSTNYPYGGMPHSETIRASCLAAAEVQTTDQRGPKWVYFMERLAASISYDTRSGPDSLGYASDRSDQFFDPQPGSQYTAPPWIHFTN